MLGQVLTLVEGDAVEAVGGVEDPLGDHAPQLQVGGQHLVVDAEALLALSGLVEGPVGGPEGLTGLGLRVQVHAGGVDLSVSAGVVHGRRSEPGEQL